MMVSNVPRSDIPNEERRSALPVGWEIKTLARLATAFISGGTPSTEKVELWDGTIPWTTSAAISENDVILSSAQRFITELGLVESATHIVPKGNLLVGTRVGVGKAVVNLMDIAISQDLTGVVLDTSQAHQEFIAYQFKTERIQNILDGRKRGTTIKGISRFDLQTLELHLPSLTEQQAIAQILQMLQEEIRVRYQEKELERECKTALMSHLFTYGLGSDSTSLRETKFGKVPTFWRILPLAQCAYVQTGVAKGRKLEGNHTVTLPYLRVANVQDGYLDLSEIKEIELRQAEIERYKLYPGDVVVTEGGDFDKLGRGFLWKGQIANCVHQNHIFAVRVNQDILFPEYFAYLIQSDYGKAYFLSVAHRTTNLASINSTKLKNFPALIPSLEEQKDIVRVLDACDAQTIVLDRELALLEELFHALLEELMAGRISIIPLIKKEFAS